MKKIKIVLLGVILAVGVFAQGKKVLAVDTCTDAKLKISGTCTIGCDTNGGTMEIDVNGACSTNLVMKWCCAPSATVKAAVDKVNAEKKATEDKVAKDKVASDLANQGCCIKSISASSPNYGKNANCYKIDLSKPIDVGNCPISGTTKPVPCSSFPTECGVQASAASTYEGTDTTGANTPITFSNPIGVTTVSGLLDSILNNLMGLIVIIAVIFIIIGGIMYMTSAGNETMVKRAKQTWTGATVGLAIALASPTFLKQIKIILESNSDTGGSADAWVNKALTIKDIAINVLNFLLSVFGILAIIALVIGGGMYLTAYGDEKKIDSGKKIITYALIGIVVALSSLVLTRQIAGLIGVMAK